jgi:alpha-beta hydrolase superfamily lysophospholipase
MKRWPCWAFALVIGLPFVVPCPSQADESERIKFETFDQVELHGVFYPGGKGQKSPCALLLHAFGGNIQKEGWEDLARKLQAEHYSVLAFDFRGHGDSTTVQAGFWNVPVNRTLKGYRPGKPKEQISYKDFTSVQTFLTLVNDISAAKRELERRNDSKDCNCSNIVLIGAESGATLGTLWTWYEWQRRPQTVGLPLLQPQRGQVEGQDIAGAVWLSLTPSFGSGNQRFNVSVDSWLRNPVREHVPMYFLYGDRDAKAANYAKRLVNTALHPGHDPKMKWTGLMAIKDTKLAGIELVGKASLPTGDQIQKYVKTLAEDRGVNPWTNRNVDSTILVRVPVERLYRQ